MKIDIRSVHCTVEDNVRDYAAEKIGHLEKYFKNIISAEISFVCHESQAAATKRYEIKVRIVIPGKDLFADAEAQDMISSVDIVEKKLKSQVQKLTKREKSGRIHRAKNFIKDFFGR